MRARQIACGHEKLVYDLPTGEDKGLLEQLNPLLFGELPVRIQPAFEGAKFLP